MVGTSIDINTLLSDIILFSFNRAPLGFPTSANNTHLFYSPIKNLNFRQQSKMVGIAVNKLLQHFIQSYSSVCCAIRFRADMGTPTKAMTQQHSIRPIQSYLFHKSVSSSVLIIIINSCSIQDRAITGKIGTQIATKVCIRLCMLISNNHEALLIHIDIEHFSVSPQLLLLRICKWVIQLIFRHRKNLLSVYLLKQARWTFTSTQ